MSVNPFKFDDDDSDNEIHDERFNSVNEAAMTAQDGHLTVNARTDRPFSDSNADHELYGNVLGDHYSQSNNADNSVSNDQADAYSNGSDQIYDLYQDPSKKLNPFDQKSIELEHLQPTYQAQDYALYKGEQDYSEIGNNNLRMSNYTLSIEKQPNLEPPVNEYYQQYSRDSSNINLNDDLKSSNNYYSSSSIFTSNLERDSDEPEIDSVEIRDDDVIANSYQNILEAGDNKVKLLDDKYYSFDYPVPKSLVDKLPFENTKEMTEFTHLRYHAITTDPKHYKSNDSEYSDVNNYINNYPFRQSLYQYPRHTELLIVCTMYNEDEVLLARTLKGIFKNIKHMMKKDSEPWGNNSWKKISVLIVSDGKNKINPKSKALLTLLGVFQEDIMQEQVNESPVNAHLFEYTTTLNIGKFQKNENGDTVVPIGTDSKNVPVQLMFLLKEQNMQKINSHRWALNFIAPNLKPEVVVLLDVGTEPGPSSIYKLWNAFKDPKVGGACGEIRAMLGNHSSMNDDASFAKNVARKIGFKFWDFTTCLLNPLVAAQNFEYKISNILDKPMESAFGFVTVLPGAFSAYRYKALQGDPLNAYFHGEDMKTNFDKPAGILESNMYLAEDRILCFELVAKRNESYLLRYIHDSYAITDVPSQIPEFINQRRRWLNGSFFAAVYSILHFYRLLISSHNLLRKMFLIIEIVYQTISILMSWFNLSMYFLVFRILTIAVVEVINEKAGNICAIVFLWVYIGALGLSFVLSFGNKPSEAKWLYTLVFALFSSIMVYMSYCVVMLSISAFKSIAAEITTTNAGDEVLQYFKNEKFRNLTISLASTYLLYILGSLIFFDLFHIFACTIQYLLLSPAYINVLAVFAFCNIHDISWGTKGALTTNLPPKAAKVTVSDSNGENELLLSEKLTDPDEMYKKAALFLKGKGPDENESDVSKNNQKISEKNYALGRTYTVVLWLVTNFVLIVVVLRTGGLEDYSDYKNETTSTTTSATTTTAYRLLKRDYWNNNNVGTVFMSVILWTVAGLALFRFIGCVYYRISFALNRRFYSKNTNYLPNVV